MVELNKTVVDTKAYDEVTGSSWCEKILKNYVLFCQGERCTTQQAYWQTNFKCFFHKMRARTTLVKMERLVKAKMILIFADALLASMDPLV